MTLRPAPGAQLSAGRLRVDATKAIAKLREYQLVDRTAWILEAIRAAVAADATAIELQGDSNDVWLSWAGTPWPAEDLPRLFDELVSPEADGSRHHVRLLAGAVNSALGANPAYVDVYAVGSDGALRARYTPDVLAAPASELEESPLRGVTAQPAPIPQDAPIGMHVHFRRRASLEVVSYWLRRADPPELVMARSACADIATPIRIGDRLFDRNTSTRDVVRVVLGDDIGGWLAVTDTRFARPHEDEIELAIAERGVLLEQATIDLGLAASAPVPLRVVIDAPRLPTNASRSEVRRDTHPVSTGERRARELVPALIAKLVTQCGPSPGDPRARHAALHLLASVIAAADWPARAHDIAPPLRALAELPLVRDAAGVPRPVCWRWSGLVYEGSSPLAPDLAPWLAHVLWAPPDDPTRAIPAHWPRPDLDRYLRTIKRQRRAEKKFYKHAAREARVLGKPKPRVRARLGAALAESCIPDAMFANVAGEVCVYAEQRGSELVVLLAGREIESVEFDSALSFAAVIDTERVTPLDLFEGIVRDDAYAHLERAMRAGVVRALEAVAYAHDQKFVDGYHVAVGATLEDDASMIKSALYLSRNLGVPLAAPFANARIWRTTLGYCSIAELRAQPVLGVVPVHTRVDALAQRIIVYADEVDRALLAEVVPSRFVPYDPGLLLDHGLSSLELATQIMGTEPHALGIDQPDLVLAILPTETPRLLVHHRGKLLAEWAYAPTLGTCTIAIDCDRIVPSADWSGVADDAGAGARDYAAYERMLACETVKALLGERAPELIGGDRVELGTPLGRWLCTSLTLALPVDVLGEDLLKQLELASLFQILGEERRFSIAELAVRFPDTVVYVEHVTEPVDGFPLLVADLAVARMVARIARRELRDGRDELAQRRAQIAHALRLGMHRAKPSVPLEVAGTHIPIANVLGNGVIGCGRDTLEIQVLVESRLFHTLTRADEAPLACVFELAGLELVDDRFEELAPGKADQLVASVRARCPDLLRAIAAQFPEALGVPGPRRALLAAFANKSPLAVELRGFLARTIQFATVQGPRANVLEASRGDGIYITTWTGEWLAGDPDALDQPVLLAAGSPELALVLAALGSLVDVTRDVARLQTQRRIARGLLPTPRCIGVMPELTRPLSDLARHLGAGEVALVAGESELLIHAVGELRERISFTCMPSIQLAIEAADLVGDAVGVATRIVPEARQLAPLLVQRILAQHEPHTLPLDIRRNLRRAILCGAVTTLHDAAVFETTTGTWLSLAAIQAQRELFGDLWCVAAIPADARPLDDRRLVLVLSLRDQGLANQHGLPAVDATQELAFDATTRRNQARPLAASLALDAPGILGTVELTGDGITAPRGWVGVLAPDAAHHRFLQCHRAMHPFERAADPCRWPTVARLDDARFTPDRCWDRPERDEIFKAAIDALHRASNDALRAIAPAPATALASIGVAPWTYDSITLLRGGDVQIRGTLYLDGPPLAAVTPTIRVVEASGESTFVPLRGLGLAGTLFVHAVKPWERETILEALCRAMHVKLVRELAITPRRRAPDLVAAHVAWALALERITPEDARQVRFACFRPAPIDAATLATILGATAPVTVVGADSDSREHALVDDGSETSRVIRTWLGNRLRPPASSRTRPDTVEPPITKLAHPLQPLVNRLHARIVSLGIQVAQWRIVDGREEPLVRYDGDTLELAANNRHVIETAGSCAANTAWAGDALDAIAAHCVTVLNVALAAITDATEARALGQLLG